MKKTIIHFILRIVFHAQLSQERIGNGIIGRFESYQVSQPCRAIFFEMKRRQVSIFAQILKQELYVFHKKFLNIEKSHLCSS